MHPLTSKLRSPRWRGRGESRKLTLLPFFPLLSSRRRCRGHCCRWRIRERHRVMRKKGFVPEKIFGSCDKKAPLETKKSYFWKSLVATRKSSGLCKVLYSAIFIHDNWRSRLIIRAGSKAKLSSTAEIGEWENRSPTQGKKVTTVREQAPNMRRNRSQKRAF